MGDIHELPPTPENDDVVVADAKSSPTDSETDRHVVRGVFPAISGRILCRSAYLPLQRVARICGGGRRHSERWRNDAAAAGLPTSSSDDNVSGSSGGAMTGDRVAQKTNKIRQSLNEGQFATATAGYCFITSRWGLPIVSPTTPEKESSL